MDDSRARYLRQQAELGGSEVILSAPLGALPPPAAVEPPPDVTPVRAREAQPEPAGGPALDAMPAPPRTPPAAAPAPTPAAAEGPMNKWKKDAPPIPGPGLVVEPPAITLLGDEVTRADSLEQVAALIAACQKCRLHQGRINVVPGEGNPAARLMCVGEGPGATEDQTGRPFVGKAGELLDQILAAIDCPRETVYIANIVKCRPPQNRKPLPDEATSCLGYLHRQIALVRPKVLVALGGTAAEWLLGVKQSLGHLRNQVHRYGGIPLVVTYHPAALLRNPNWKKPTWDDVRIARQLLDG